MANKYKYEKSIQQRVEDALDRFILTTNKAPSVVWLGQQEYRELADTLRPYTNPMRFQNLRYMFSSGIVDVLETTQPGISVADDSGFVVMSDSDLANRSRTSGYAAMDPAAKIPPSQFPGFRDLLSYDFNGPLKPIKTLGVLGRPAPKPHRFESSRRLDLD